MEEAIRKLIAEYQEWMEKCGKSSCSFDEYQAKEQTIQLVIWDLEKLLTDNTQ